MSAENTASKQRGRPFKAGTSGNPAGKPKGSRHRLTLLAEGIMEGEAADVVRTVLERAKSGDMVAARLILERISPPRKGRTVMFELPEMKTGADVLAAFGAVTRAISNGELTPDEGVAIAGLLEAQKRAIDGVAIERRLTVLEAGQWED